MSGVETLRWRKLKAVLLTQEATEQLLFGFYEFRIFCVCFDLSTPSSEHEQERGRGREQTLNDG